MEQLGFDFVEQSPPQSQQRPAAAPDVVSRAFDAASTWSAHLADKLGERIRLVITDNRRVVISAARKRGRLEVRLHHMFLEAEQDIWDAVVDYLEKGDRRSSATIDSFVEENRQRLVASAERQTILRTKGEIYDLDDLMHSLAKQYFSKDLDVKITWGKRVRPKRGQRSLQLGTYVPEEKLIRVHPVLDQAWVPRFYIEAVVYHELLHHDMPAIVDKGRHHYHTRAFREREEQFEYHDQALRWEKDNLWRLLRRGRRGKALK